MTYETLLSQADHCGKATYETLKVEDKNVGKIKAQMSWKTCDRAADKKRP